MPGIINQHRASIRKNAKFIRLTHLKNNAGSLFLSDLDTAENKQGNNKIPCYIPYGLTIDILLTDRTITSYQQGSIRGFIDANFLEGFVVQNLEVEEGKGLDAPVYDVSIDEELVTANTSGGDVLLNLPDILNSASPLDRIPEGTRLTVKKITDDSNKVIIQASSGNLIEGSPDAYVIEEYLDLVTLQSDDQGNWWVIGCGCTGNSTVPDLFLLSHYNTSDGSSNASVLDITHIQSFVSTSSSGSYGTGGWDDEILHPVSRTGVLSYVNQERATQLQSGTITATVSYYDATETVRVQTLSFPTDGSEQTIQVPGLEVEVSGIIPDFTSKAGFIETRIIPLSLPGFLDGGRIISFSTSHDIGADSYLYEDTQGVFFDNGPSPPENEGSPNITIESPTLLHLSGVPHYTNGTRLRIEQGFIGAFDQTYINQPFLYDARGLGQDFGQSSLDWNAPEIDRPNASVESDDRADMDEVVTLQGSSTCSEGGAVTTRVRDGFNTSIPAQATLDLHLIYNKVTSSSRNFEDFRDESRRLMVNSSNTSPDDRDLGNWDSLQNLLTFDGGQGLQVISCKGSCDGILSYPQADYTGYAPVGPNYSGVSGQIYEGVSNVRWYYRFFSNSSGTVEHSGGVIRIELCSGLITVQDLLSDNIFVEVMLANPNGDVIGGGRSEWLSLNLDFNNAIFDPLGNTRAQRGCLTNTSESNQATSSPDFGFTLSSNAFPLFTSLGSNYGIRVRIGIRPDVPYDVSGLTLVGW